MRNKNSFDQKSEQGTALVTTLLFMTVMGMLSTALVFTVQNEMKTSTSYKYSQQAFYVAHAGVQKALNWYKTGYSPYVPSTAYDTTTLPIKYSGSNVQLAGQTGSSPAYPDSTVSSAFAAQFSNKSLTANSQNSGVYALNGSLLKYLPVSFIDPNTFSTYTSAIERWRINSIGYWGSVANPMGVARIDAVIENSGNALFDRALWGIDHADLGGTVLVDSYDPALGPYNKTTNVGDLGSVGSNGSVTASGAVEIHGDLAYGPSGSYSSTPNVTVTGDIFHLTEPKYFPPIPDFSVGSTDYNPKNGTTTLNPGSYGAITIGPSGTLELNPGTYYFDSITEASTGALKITGPTTIFVKSALDLTGQGVINPLGDPTKLTIFYSGTAEMKMAGGSQAYVEVYAPNAPVKLDGNSDFFGSFIGKTMFIQGTPEVHFDEGCTKEHLIQQPFRLITWSQNTE
jgi:Tfp pilus assembly protein PilX